MTDDIVGAMPSERSDVGMLTLRESMPPALPKSPPLAIAHRATVHTADRDFQRFAALNCRYPLEG